MIGFHSKSGDGCQKNSDKSKRKCQKKFVLALSLCSLLIVSVWIAAVNHSFSLHNLQNSDIPNASATSSQEHFTTVAQKLHFSPELTVTINSGKPPSVGNFNITKGYKMEPVLWNLTLPSSVTFDDTGNMYVAESGYARGELETTPQIFKIDVNGTISSFVDRHLYGPITDLVYHEGKLYVSNRGKISTVNIQNHHVQDIIMALPGLGDHPVDQIAFGPDGRLYFGIGTATNSGVVGEDNYEWLKLLPTFHDIPAKQIKLAGQNFDSGNPLTPIKANGKNMTGGFSPFGNASREDEVVKGDVKCSGCIISARPDGTDLRLVAWGIRNPYGLTFDNGNGKHLTVTDSGAEERGSRPIANDSDKIYSIDVSKPGNLGKFYGWPDFYGNAEPVTEPKFRAVSSKEQPLQFLMQEHPTVEKPLSLLSGLNGIAQIAFSNNSAFGFNGMGFIAQLGKILPTTTSSINTEKQAGKITGQKIVVFDTGKKGIFRNFVSLKKPDPSFRPVSVKFNQDNTALYIVSIGKEEIRKTSPSGYPLARPTPWFYQHSGVVWKVTNASAVVGLAATQPPKKLHLSPELTVTINSGRSPSTDVFNLPSQYKMEPVLWNLDLPGSFAFDNKGNMYVASVGITYGRVTTNPSIIKIDHNGTVSIFVDRFLHGTLSDIEFNKNNGLLYVSHRALISTVNLTSGVVKDLVTALPMTDYGTHPMGQLSIGPDGRIYFGVGSVSNTAVPDISDYGIGWIRDMPQLHEIPGQNIKLTGQNFESHNFLDPNSNDKVITGGFSTFGIPTREGQMVKGNIKCTSCILSIKPDGSDLRLHAWGIRNPYGLVINDKGILFADTNGADDKGIRRITNDPDTIFKLNIKKPGLTFFGWPDFYGLGQSVNGSIFNQSPSQNYINQPLIKNPPQVTKPSISLGMSVAATQAAISTNDNFGSKGKIFIGEFGTIAPVTHVFHESRNASAGQVMGQLIGQKVVVVDPQSSKVQDFIALNSVEPSWRPVGIQFTPDGNTLYIASIEREEVRNVTPTGTPLPSPADWPYLKTGIIWKVTHVSGGQTQK